LHVLISGENGGEIMYSYRGPCCKGFYCSSIFWE